MKRPILYNRPPKLKHFFYLLALLGMISCAHLTVSGKTSEGITSDLRGVPLIMEGCSPDHTPPMSAKELAIWKKSIAYYKSAEYDEAIDLLKQLLKSAEDEEVRANIYFYMGVCYFAKDGDNLFALSCFSRVAYGKHHAHNQDKALWYVALTYLKIDPESPKAKAVLARIANSPSHYKNIHAERILKAL